MGILFAGILTIVVILMLSVADIYHGEGLPDEDESPASTYIHNLL